MFEELEAVRARYDAINDRLADPTVLQDLKEVQRLGKEQAQLRPLVDLYQRYRRAEQAIADARQLLETERDEEMVDYARQELERQQTEQERLARELHAALVPKDPNDDKDVIVEIRGGTGGEEAALFAADLFKMYSRYAELKRWRVELLSSSVTERGGFKEVIFEVRGKGAYSRLKLESGVHRVQRVPETEAQGRIHTSTATVVVMPEAVRLTYTPEDGGEPIVVAIQDERSQLKNRAKAEKVLKTRLLARQQEQEAAQLTKVRRSAVGTADRSEKVRTYNYPEGRITDHRIDLKYYKLPQFLTGDLDPVLDRLLAADQANRLSGRDGGANGEVP